MESEENEKGSCSSSSSPAALESQDPNQLKLKKTMQLLAKYKEAMSLLKEEKKQDKAAIQTLQGQLLEQGTKIEERREKEIKIKKEKEEENEKEKEKEKEKDTAEFQRSLEHMEKRHNEILQAKDKEILELSNKTSLLDGKLHEMDGLNKDIEVQRRKDTDMIKNLESQLEEERKKNTTLEVQINECKLLLNNLDRKHSKDVDNDKIAVTSSASKGKEEKQNEEERQQEGKIKQLRIEKEKIEREYSQQNMQLQKLIQDGVTIIEEKKVLSDEISQVKEAKRSIEADLEKATNNLRQMQEENKRLNHDLLQESHELTKLKNTLEDNCRRQNETIQEKDSILSISEKEKEKKSTRIQELETLNGKLKALASKQKKVLQEKATELSTLRKKEQERIELVEAEKVRNESSDIKEISTFPIFPEEFDILYRVAVSIPYHDTDTDSSSPALPKIEGNYSQEGNDKEKKGRNQLLSKINWCFIKSREPLLSSNGEKTDKNGHQEFWIEEHLLTKYFTEKQWQTTTISNNNTVDNNNNNSNNSNKNNHEQMMPKLPEILQDIFQKTVDRLSLTLEKKSTDLQSMQVEYDRYKARANAVLKKATEQSRQGHKQEEEIQALKDEILYYGQKIEALQKQIEEKDTEICKEENQQSELLTTIQHLTEKNQLLTTQELNFQDKLQVLENIKKELNEDIQDRDESISKLKEKLMQFEENHATNGGDSTFGNKNNSQHNTEKQQNQLHQLLDKSTNVTYQEILSFLGTSADGMSDNNIRIASSTSDLQSFSQTYHDHDHDHNPSHSHSHNHNHNHNHSKPPVSQPPSQQFRLENISMEENVNGAHGIGTSYSNGQGSGHDVDGSQLDSTRSLRSNNSFNGRNEDQEMGDGEGIDLNSDFGDTVSASGMIDSGHPFLVVERLTAEFHHQRAQDAALIAELREEVREYVTTIAKNLEQFQVLKSTIRNLEDSLARNQELHQDSINLDYLKNIVLSYLVANSDKEQQTLMHVIATVLKFSVEEIARIEENSQNNKSWKRYLPL